MTFSNVDDKVPMMFRAQVNGRCQLQYAQSEHIQTWKHEWTEAAATKPLGFAEPIQTSKECKISWRFVTNGGQDDGIIRPVIDSMGIPFYPGSSMKGAFRKACEQMEKAKELPVGTSDLYCGTKPSKNKDENSTKPGILRFHGGYPINNGWTENLIDVVHPQQGWQVGIPQQESHSAKVLISLYKPNLQFGISSTLDLDKAQWQQIWQIWDKALSMGLGGRVSAGYGQPNKHSSSILYKVSLHGQGQAANLLDGSTEFRPNIFRASLRGHALRIFGGLTTADNAEQLVAQLFGGIQGTTQVGLLSMAFHQTSPAQELSDTYTVEGDLKWLLTRPLPEQEKSALRELVKHLTQFAMLLGGFGKSWRRADHRKFPLDDGQIYDDHLIGCHWQWAGQRSPVYDNPVRKLEEIAPFIEHVQSNARNWMQIQNQTDDGISSANWRESWFKENVQVWGRRADLADDSLAINWLHGNYSSDPEGNRLTIQGSTVTGKLNQIGRLWHRMYPVVLRQPDPNDPKKALPKLTNRYLELLTLFPDDTTKCDRFLQFLESDETDFEKCW